MDYQQRPPRSTRPTTADGNPALRHNNVSFQNTERGDRAGPVDPRRQYYDPESGGASPLSPGLDPSRVARKKSLVRPDREKIEPGHRQWHYRTHVMEQQNGTGRVGVMPSTTGNYPQLRRGKSLLGREEDVQESGLNVFKRGTLRRKRQSSSSSAPLFEAKTHNRSCLGDFAPGPKGPWMVYCYLLTCFVPPFLLRSCGMKTPEQQRAWREKMGLISIILSLMAGVGFLTFGFTEAVCGKPPNRFHGGAVGDQFIGKGSVTINGYDYNFENFTHPAAPPTFDGHSNPVLDPSWHLAGNDASFLFQNVNQRCLGLITKAPNSTISGQGNNLDWYFPCNVINQDGSGSNKSFYDQSTNCHNSANARTMFKQLVPQGQVYFTWDDVKNPQRSLAVFESSVLDLNLLTWLSRAYVNYPAIFDQMTQKDGTYNNRDITMLLYRTNQQAIGQCLEDIVRVGFIDTQSIGCVASTVVLYVSLIFIIGVVAIRFVMAVMFSWFFSWKLGNFPRETYEQRMQRSREIENWTNDIYRPAPGEYRPNVSKNGLRKEKRKTFLPNTSRFTPSDSLKPGGRPTTVYGNLETASNKRNTYAPSTKSGNKLTPPDSPSYRNSRSTMSFPENLCPFPLHNVVPQPPPDYEPFNFPLAHTICLVTAYSESVEGLRTTLDSLATTDYPNSHKLILVIADGMVKGAGNTLTTPEICLTMMKEFVVPPDRVEPHSYVAIADGHKRHNMAKVFAGFYDYDDATVERSKQQRVPIVLVAKVGNPLEADDPKPGNRGKRDSQIVLMAFLQKVMFDERMTTFEYEFFNSIWRVTGVSPDRYELVLCVDADTKVFPDSMTRMVACMVHDEEIMGLCGETKIANKAETFVTMMQVFEYYISHHMAKAFESMFGGVTCLPGCFSMYRIKAPKGDSGYWVPILANPDVVEHYSENVVDTLHKKNLLLLGEDRYLTTLMLKTFPKRKNMFCPQAVCKTVVPDTFRVLLSQRRRWINSTIHNLAELLLVRDLCGTFCFSMQFIVGMELAGTLVLPAAIAFTLYLIISSIIPGGPNNTIPLVLLAIVLGLPGILIVITSKKVEYVGWMLVYLISLPIWNGVLPAYAFWHFDDFSWGQTRIVTGDKKDFHGDKEGEFDSSHIVMKRWAEFERERRWKSGTQSRDSMYDRKTDNTNRYSIASSSDVNHDDSTLSGSGGHQQQQRKRHDSTGLLQLPVPLSSDQRTSMSRSSEEHYSESNSSNQRLVPSPQSIDQYSDSYEATSMSSVPTYESPIPTRAHNSASPTAPFLGNPFYSSSPTSEEHPIYSPDSSEPSSPYRSSASAQAARGIQLTDSGPVPGPEGVRRVSRSGNKRANSQNRYSRNSTVFQLPPGAAPPQPQQYTGYPSQ